MDVTVVIPTKDQANLLEICIAGLKRTKHARIEIIVVDNGSREERTKEVYRTLAHDPKFRIVYAPGRFNFAKLCNEGARVGRSSALLFLNNDVEILDDNWVTYLLPWAYKRSIGAVGAKLLYPSGRVQHGGMVLGLKGNAGHVDTGIAGDSPGYLGRFALPHEVMAVTGACLAVERAKFEAVGGFDAEHFPVELNDVDLCLRLRAKGWCSIMVPGCCLIHHESATRGRTHSAHLRYPKENDAFRKRWGEMIFDDPYFHPALSLTSMQVALG
jgi:GT2 family glycosyltransferase